MDQAEFEVHNIAGEEREARPNIPKGIWTD